MQRQASAPLDGCTSAEAIRDLAPCPSLRVCQVYFEVATPRLGLKHGLYILISETKMHKRPCSFIDELQPLDRLVSTSR